MNRQQFPPANQGGNSPFTPYQQQGNYPSNQNRMGQNYQSNNPHQAQPSPQQGNYPPSNGFQSGMHNNSSSNPGQYNNGQPNFPRQTGNLNPHQAGTGSPFTPQPSGPFNGPNNMAGQPFNNTGNLTQAPPLARQGYPSPSGNLNPSGGPGGPPFTPPPANNNFRAQPPQSKGPGTKKILLFLLILIPVVIAGVAGTYLVQKGNGGKLPIVGQPAQPTKKPLTPDEIKQQALLAEQKKIKDYATNYLKKMTLDEKIGQTMMVEYGTAEYSDDLDVMLHELHAGGVIIYQSQLQTAEQAKNDMSKMQERATTPLLISVDEEGWNVGRLGNIYEGKRKAARDIRDSQSTTVASEEGKKVAQDMLAVGLNMNLAPDVDVSNDDNGYIGWDLRAFGETPEDVIKYAGPYMKAMQENGVVGCIKHFPGIGAIPKTADPHAVLTSLDRTKDQLENVDLAPFKHFINSKDKWEKADCIMPSDVLIPSIDPKYPAELSPTFMTKILREEMGYQGVALTDALIMGGVQIDGQPLTIDHAVVLALQAGNDMTLGVSNADAMRTTIEAVKTALNDGTLTQARLDEAVTRDLILKIQHGLIKMD